MRQQLAKAVEKSEEEIRESMWIEVIKNVERLYAELANTHTEIEQKDRELKSAKSFTDNIIKSMKNVLLVCDEKGKIKLINQAGLSLLGYEAHELTGQKVDEVFADSAKSKKVIKKSICPHGESEGTLDLESVFIAKSGVKIPMAISCSTLKDDNENVIGTVLVAQDLRNIKDLIRKAAKAAQAYRIKALELEKAYNELQQLQSHLVQAEKLAYLGKLAAGIAHEINNPLTSVLGIASFLLKKMSEDDPMNEDFQLIVEETKRCKRIVEDLLEFSRQREPEKSPADINKIIEESLVIIEKQHFFHNISIIKKFCDQLPEVMIDKSQIKQVFMNMILNAYDAMPDGGALTVETALTDDGKFIDIKFIDTGTGILEADIPRLFDPFFTTKGKAKGVGLGLSVSHSIITRHGGDISVASTVGQGSTFTIKLPVMKGTKNVN